MTQLVARIDEQLANAVDELVAEGGAASRSDAVRQGLYALLDAHGRNRTATRIVDGYRRVPQRQEEVGWADDATRRMIADEPW